MLGKKYGKLIRIKLPSPCGENPLSHGLRRASSPKGTPLGYAGNFTAAAKAVPLGKGAKPQALTEGVARCPKAAANIFYKTKKMPAGRFDLPASSCLCDQFSST